MTLNDKNPIALMQEQEYIIVAGEENIYVINKTDGKVLYETEYSDKYSKVSRILSIGSREFVCGFEDGHIAVYQIY